MQNLISLPVKIIYYHVYPWNHDFNPVEHTLEKFGITTTPEDWKRDDLGYHSLVPIMSIPQAAQAYSRGEIDQHTDILITRYVDKAIENNTLDLDKLQVIKNYVLERDEKVIELTIKSRGTGTYFDPLHEAFEVMTHILKEKDFRLRMFINDMDTLWTESKSNLGTYVAQSLKAVAQQALSWKNKRP